MKRMVGWFAVLALMSVGCGGGLQTVPVRGKVTFGDGGPLKGGRVEFRSEAEATKNLNARGEVDADGDFKLTTFVDGKELDGAVVGPHKVTVFPPDYTQPASLDSQPPPSPVPQRYRSYDSSKLEVTVEPGKADYPIRLERK